MADEAFGKVSDTKEAPAGAWMVVTVDKKRKVVLAAEGEGACHTIFDV